MKAGFLALFIASACFADTIDFASTTSTPNSTGKPSILAFVDPSWASPLNSPLPSFWITATGDLAPLLGTSVTYTETFVLPAGFTDAVLNLGVFADDSATVKIDGTTLFTEDTKLGAHCAAGPIGCVTGTEGIITNMNVTADLHPGTNTITFKDYQEVGGTPFGIDFDGSLSYSSIDREVSAVPEPSSIVLLFTGLGCIGFGQCLRKLASKRAKS